LYFITFPENFEAGFSFINAVGSPFVAFSDGGTRPAGSAQRSDSESRWNRNSAGRIRNGKGALFGLVELEFMRGEDRKIHRLVSKILDRDSADWISWVL
jgi:hypothetical protein